jgi:hypothetical protein
MQEKQSLSKQGYTSPGNIVVGMYADRSSLL